jgi:hypothetical protein
MLRRLELKRWSRRSRMCVTVPPSSPMSGPSAVSSSLSPKSETLTVKPRGSLGLACGEGREL